MGNYSSNLSPSEIAAQEADAANFVWFKSIPGMGIKKLPPLTDDDDNLVVSPNQPVTFFCDARFFTNLTVHVLLQTGRRTLIDQHKTPNSGFFRYDFSHETLVEEFFMKASDTADLQITLNHNAGTKKVRSTLIVVD